MKLAQWELLREETLAELARLREEMETKLAACESRLLAKLEEAKLSIVANEDTPSDAATVVEAAEPRDATETGADSPTVPIETEPEASAAQGGLDTLIGLLDASKEGDDGEAEKIEGESEAASTREPLSMPSDTPSAEPILQEEQSGGASPTETSDEREDGVACEDDDLPALEEAITTPTQPPPPAAVSAENERAAAIPRSQSIQPLLRPKPPARPPRRPKGEGKERPASMWIAGGGGPAPLSAPQLQRSQDTREKRRSSAFSLAREREAPPAAKPEPGPPGGSPLRHLRSSLLTAGRTQSIPNMIIRPQQEEGDGQKSPLAAQTSAADVEEAMKVVAAAVFKGLMEVESSLEAQPPRKLKGFVNGRALASFLVRLLRLRSRNEALKLLNAVAARYIMDATCQADSTPIIMDEVAEWFGFKIPVFMFPEKLAQQAAKAAETVLGHRNFGPCDVSRIFADKSEVAAMEAEATVELLRGPVETSGEKAKKWHKRFAVLTKQSLKLFRSSDMGELVGEHAIKSLVSLVSTPAKSGARSNSAKASQFTLCFVAGDNRTAFSVKVCSHMIAPSPPPATLR